MPQLANCLWKSPRSRPNYKALALAKTNCMTSLSCLAKSEYCMNWCASNGADTCASLAVNIKLKLGGSTVDKKPSVGTCNVMPGRLGGMLPQLVAKTAK